LNRETLRKLVADALQLPLDKVPANASSEMLEDWDSLRHLDIILAVESAANFKFPTAEIVELTSLDKLEAALAKNGLKR
jgi:acyl carrier protein